MESKKFDSMTRGLTKKIDRRTTLKGLIAGAAGLVGLRSMDAGATGHPSLTIHNRSCAKMVTGMDVYNLCHNNGFGCIDFHFRSRTVRTNTYGNAMTTLYPGWLTLSQQASRVNLSKAVWVYCEDKVSGRIAFDNWAPTGKVTFKINDGETVVCDWYNYTSKNLALPGQCSYT